MSSADSTERLHFKRGLLFFVLNDGLGEGKKRQKEGIKANFQKKKVT